MAGSETFVGISEHISKVCHQLPPSSLRTGLLQGVQRNTEAFNRIETCFQALIAAPQAQEAYRHFFGTWRSTNNSAMCVSGLSNRLSMLAFKQKRQTHNEALLTAIASLNRISDEDLGVGGGVLHSELFARMANYIVGDDSWKLDRYLSHAGVAYARWKNQRCLAERDLMVGLLTTAVHEVYTHGEVEYMLPLFLNWVGAQRDDSKRTIAYNLAWITVHCGPTERDHFRHAVDAIEQFSRALNCSVEGYDVASYVDSYLIQKAAVMDSILNVLSELADQSLPPPAANQRTDHGTRVRAN